MWVGCHLRWEYLVAIGCPLGGDRGKKITTGPEVHQKEKKDK
jgi:hypothetical protein